MSGLGINFNLLLAQTINFVVVLLLLRQFLYRPIMKMLDERRERISSSLAEADLAREAAATEREQLEQQLAEERRTSQERLRTAVTKSEEAAKQRLDEANVEAEQIVTRARGEAQEIRAEALSGMHGEIAELALLAASKALGEGIDEARHRSLIDSFLDKELGELA